MPRGHAGGKRVEYGICFAATTLAAHPAGRRCASGQSPLPLCCAKCPERGRRALSPSGAAPLVPSCAGDTRQRLALAARGRGLPLASHAHDTGTEAAPSPHAMKSNPILHPRQKSPPRRRALCGWSMGFEPMTTGTTIRGSTAELTPPLQRKVAGRV